MLYTIEDSKLKRSGLDYWKYIQLYIYDSIEDFYMKNIGEKMLYFSSHGEKDFWSIDYQDGLFLIFGKESNGLPKNILENNHDLIYKIPIINKHVRSLNLSNAVGIVVYEGLRSIIKL